MAASVIASTMDGASNFDALNLLNTETNQITYAYGSLIKTDQPVRSVRLGDAPPTAAGGAGRCRELTPQDERWSLQTSRAGPCARVVGRRSLAPVLPLPLGLPRVAQHAHVGAKNSDSRGAPVMPLLLWVSAWIVLTETIQIQIEQWLRSGPSVFQGLPWTPHGRKRKSPRTPVPRGRIVVSNSIAFGPAVTPPTTGPLCHGIPVRLANRAVENGRAQRLPKCAPRTSRRFETQ